MMHGAMGAYIWPGCQLGTYNKHRFHISGNGTGYQPDHKHPPREKVDWSPAMDLTQWAHKQRPECH